MPTEAEIETRTAAREKILADAKAARLARLAGLKAATTFGVRFASKPTIGSTSGQRFTDRVAPPDAAEQAKRAVDRKKRLKAEVRPERVRRSARERLTATTKQIADQKAAAPDRARAEAERKAEFYEQQVAEARAERAREKAAREAAETGDP